MTCSSARLIEDHFVQTFSGLPELQKLVASLEEMPFDDDRVEFDTTFENKLAIKFNNVDGRTATDDEGREREVFQQLVINNFTGFEILEPDDGTHYFKSISEVGDSQYEFAMTKARWLIRLNGDLCGHFAETTDDTDFELTLSSGTLVLVAAGVVGVIVALFWIF